MSVTFHDFSVSILPADFVYGKTSIHAQMPKEYSGAGYLIDLMTGEGSALRTRRNDRKSPRTINIYRVYHRDGY